jgi:Positive regulator of sigma(E), RseC/MucC
VTSDDSRTVVNGVVGREGSCPLCAGTKGCAALGLLRWTGDEVASSADPISTRAVLLYLVPLLALLLSALCAVWFAADNAAQRDLYAAAGVVFGLAVAFVVLRRVTRRAC